MAKGITLLGRGQQLLDFLYPNPTPDVKLDIQTAMAAMGQAASEIVRMGILQSKAETRVIPGNWVAEYPDVEIKYSKGKYYSDLPVNVIALPDDQGIYLVWQGNDMENPLLPVSAGFLYAYKNHPASLLGGSGGFYLLEDRIYYIQDMSGCECVNMLLIPQFSQLGEMDYFPVDDGVINSVLERAAKLYATQKGIPSDIQTDNIST